MALENGYLKKYFKGVVVKKLSAVEVVPKTSNQHEFHATTDMKEIFGVDKRKYQTTFLYIDDEHSYTSADYLTWYDARKNNPARSAEYRLYYPSTTVSEKASEGDSLFICLKQDDTILCIVADKEATITSQLYWIFGLETNDGRRFTQNKELSEGNNHIEFLARTILAQIGIEFDDKTEVDLLEELNGHFGGIFPKTDVFSAYARSLIVDVDPIEDPDNALVQWYNMEEKLFFLLEQQSIKDCLKRGFVDNDEVDVSGFIKFSLSVQNRRKARAGLSFENHIAAILKANEITYSHTPITENKAKPDFLFPDIKCYRDATFPSEYLSMLGAKSTCKDRWRQVLSEADRIEHKHLLTLEAAISTFQTDEMRDKKLQLVVPGPIHKTYTEQQQTWLYTVKDFLDEVKDKQRKAGNHQLILGVADV